ncbi:MAG: type 1 glutamine amidotransferase [Gammaproteobacteria bacterium]|nr:MAG: type 1 glutamine amidotransferase [Gammaproteobacteria bacterium]
MQICFLQHVPFETPARIQSWAKKHSIPTHTVHLYRNEALPDPREFDILIIMGGPMGVNQSDTYPWLENERDLVKRTLDHGKKVLGICLGAQMIAAALGASVYPNSNREFGWFPIDRINPSSREVWPQTGPLTVLHWHGDTFDLPAGSELIASSKACRQQGFIYGSQVLGLQCHLEMDAMAIQSLLQNCRNDLNHPGAYIQSESDILAYNPQPSVAHALQGLLDRFLL